MNAVPVRRSARPSRAVAERTAVVRGALVVALVVLVLVAALRLRGIPHPQTAQSLPVRSGDMIVLDLSASISSDTFSRIGETLRRLVATAAAATGSSSSRTSPTRRCRPGTPASALRPLVRYFTLPAQTAPGRGADLPDEPVERARSAAARAISAGLDLAHRILLANHLGRSRVVLVSDLADDPEDIQRLNQVATTEYGRNRTPLRVVALNAAPDDAAFFARIADAAIDAGPGAGGGRAGASRPRRPRPVRSRRAARGDRRGRCLLAAHALWTARLRWRPATEPVT